MNTTRQATALRMAVAPEWVAIIAALSKQPRYVGELACLLNLPQPTVSNRLRAMRKAGLVCYSEEQCVPAPAVIKYHTYSLVPDAVQAVVVQIRATAQEILETAAHIEDYVKGTRVRIA